MTSTTATPRTTPAVVGDEVEIGAVDENQLDGGDHAAAGNDAADDADFAPRRARFEADKRHRLAVIGAQRTALLDARDNGIFDADVLENALDNLDATQITLEMRGKSAV